MASWRCFTWNGSCVRHVRGFRRPTGLIDVGSLDPSACSNVRGATRCAQPIGSAQDVIRGERYRRPSPKGERGLVRPRSLCAVHSARNLVFRRRFDHVAIDVSRETVVFLYAELRK